jgi:hypothetical protein
VEF